MSIDAPEAGYPKVAALEPNIDDVGFSDVTCGLADAFGDHMVLQRDKPVPVWGWAKSAGQKITLTFRGRTREAVADEDCHWKVVLDPMNAGGPFEMSLSDNSLVATDVMVGDVWLCTGQSNMDFGIDQVSGLCNHAPEVIDQADCPNVRLWSAADQMYTTPQWGYKRQRGRQARWMRCTPQNAPYGRWGGFSAIGYFFGREIQRDIGEPIGLVKIDFGGTSVQ
jgi:sialate O-acetylesterase